MQTTHWNSKLFRLRLHETRHLTRQSWLLFSGLAGVLCAALSPLPF